MQGIIPDMMIKDNNAHQRSMDNSPTMYDNKDTLMDVKTLGPGLCYKKKNYKTKPVDTRQERVNSDYHKHAKDLDNKYNNDDRIMKKLDSFGNEGRVAGLVIGAFGEMSDHMNQLALFISKREAENRSQQMNMDIHKIKQLQSRILKSLKISWGLTAHRGWARLLINRTALLITRDGTGEADSGGDTDEEDNDDMLDEEDLWIQQ